MRYCHYCGQMDGPQGHACCTRQMGKDELVEMLKGREQVTTNIESAGFLNGVDYGAKMERERILKELEALIDKTDTQGHPRIITTEQMMKIINGES